MTTFSRKQPAENAVRIHIVGDQVHLVLTSDGNKATAEMRPEVAVTLGVSLINAAYAATRPQLDPQPAPALRKPGGRKWRGGGA